LKRIAQGLLSRRESFARLLTMEQGKPLAQSLGEVDYAASFFQWFGEEARWESLLGSRHGISRWRKELKRLPLRSRLDAPGYGSLLRARL
jgi:acyl-CoA reductase-like NAD-dependent aldehyde dehydrogenase